MTVRIIIGDVREKLAEMPDESVHCVVTSPPYFGLRDYGTASWEGGDPACDHLGPPMRTNAKPTDNSSTFHGGTSRANEPMGKSCNKCGATRTDKQIGLEPTPVEFVAVMVDVFREVRRVLRKDGTLWLNLGDSYASGGGAGGVGTRGGLAKAAERADGKPRNAENRSDKDGALFAGDRPSTIGGGTKAKDLLGIPWRVAFALQADGWYLRQDLIWSKPNPMPESVTDRCTKAHEYLFLLSKSARYHYDAEAIAEDALRAGDPNLGDRTGDNALVNGGWLKGGEVPSTRNRRSVWTVATQPFSAAHFATFPPALIEPCIKAGCPKDCCAKCGAPVVRVMETNNPSKHAADPDNTLGWSNTHSKTSNAQSSKSLHRNPGGVYSSAVFAGWSPSCSCDAGLVRGVCLDPFGGAGTTGLVADRLQRDAILIELNPAYAALARARIEQDAGPLFASVVEHCEPSQLAMAIPP